VWLGSGKDPLSDWWFQTCSIFHNVWDNPSHWRTHIFQDGSNHQPAILLLTYKPNIAAGRAPQWNVCWLI
jgi:hypothetical protein